MIMIKEADVSIYAKNLPVMKSCCPANDNTKREYVKQVLADISKQVPNVREMAYTALTHPERYNLFDKFNDQIDKF